MPRLKCAWAKSGLCSIAMRRHRSEPSRSMSSRRITPFTLSAPGNIGVSASAASRVASAPCRSPARRCCCARSSRASGTRLPWHCLKRSPLPQGQGWLRPVTAVLFTPRRGECSAFAFEEAAQLLGARGMAELPQRLRLDLADALARDVELLADFLERVVGVHLDAEAHSQHLRLAWRQRIEDVLAHVAQRCIDRGVRGRDRRLVFDEIAKMRIVVVA